MDILVGELAKLYGLSSQTLHYYEDKGILKPKRSTTNGYRYYETSDLSRLGSIKKYRNADFGLSEGLKLLEDATESEIAKYYQKQKEKLWKEIQQKQLLVKQLDDDLVLYSRYKVIGSEFVEEELEGFVRFESVGTEIIFQDPKMRREATSWFKNIMYTHASYMYYVDESKFRFKHRTYGIAATKSTASYLQLEKSDSVSTIDGGLFLTSVMNTKSDGCTEDYINKCIEYVKTNGYLLRGNPFSRIIFIISKRDKVDYMYNVFYIPVKRSKK